MIWIHFIIDKLHAVTKLLCVLYEGRSSHGEKLDFFLVLKYIIFVKIINNFTHVIVPVFTLHHHGTILWSVFSRQLFRWFWCLWRCLFCICCRVINRSFFLCYCYFCSQVSIICRVNYVFSERMDFRGRSFIHNI